MKSFISNLRLKSNYKARICVILIASLFLTGLPCGLSFADSKNTISTFNLNTEKVKAHFEDVMPHYINLNLPSLKKEIDPIIQRLSKQTKVTEFSIYAKDLKTNTIYTWNSGRMADTTTFGHEEAYYKGASVAKLYEVFAVYRLAEAGFVDLDQPIKDRYTGYKFTLRQAIAKAIRKSDNDSFCRILRAVGPDNINAVLEEYGIENNYIYAELGPAKGFSVANNVLRYKTSKSSRVNPSGAGMILEMVYREAGKGNPYMKEFKINLLNNMYTSRIPAALRYKTAVAHKTGTIESEGVYHDAGIVYSKSPYIIAIYTKDAPNATVAHVFIRGAVRAISSKFISKRATMDLAYKANLKSLTNVSTSTGDNTGGTPENKPSSNKGTSNQLPKPEVIIDSTTDPAASSDLNSTP